VHVPVDSRALRQLTVGGWEQSGRYPGREVDLDELVADGEGEHLVDVQRETGQAGVGGERLDELCERRRAPDGKGIEHFFEMESFSEIRDEVGAVRVLITAWS
jgi:hypothetical protein